MAQSSASWTPCYVRPEEGVAFFDGITIRSDLTTAFVVQRVRPVLEEHVAVCRFLELALKMSLDRKPRVLVAEAGAGVFAVWAAKQGCSVVALEANPRALWMIEENARENGVSDRVEVRENSFLDYDLPSTDEKFDVVILEPPFVVGSSSGLLFLPTGYLAVEDDNLSGQSRINDLALALARKSLAEGGALVALIWHQSRTGAPVIASGLESRSIPRMSLESGTPKPRTRYELEIVAGSCEVDSFLSYCVASAPRSIRLESSYSFVGILRRVLLLENSTQYMAEPSWYHLYDWDHVRDTEAQLFARTAVPFTLPSGPYFVDDARRGNRRLLPRAERTALPERGEASSDLAPPIRIFGDYLQKQGFLGNLFNGVLLDTAPYYVTATQKDLSQTVGLWCGGSWHSESDAILQSYIALVRANINSGLTLFLHPHRFFNLLRWKTIHCSFVGELSTESLSRQLEAAGILFAHQAREHRNKYAPVDHAELGEVIAETASEKFILYQESAERLNAPVSEMQAKEKHLAILDEIKRFFPHVEAEEPDGPYHALHLASSELTAHYRFREILKVALQKQAPRYSRLFSLPLAFAPSAVEERKLSVGPGPEARAFRGVAWLWLFSRTAWTSEHEAAADALAHQMSLVLDNFFFAYSAKRLAAFERDLLRIALSHEGQNLIRKIHQRGWVLPGSRFFEVSSREGVAKGDRAGILFDRDADGRLYPWRSADEVGVVPFLDLFRAAGNLLLSWLPQDRVDDLPFSDELRGNPVSLEQLVQAAWVETKKVSLVHFLRPKVSGESGIAELVDLNLQRQQLEFLLSNWRCDVVQQDGAALPLLSWDGYGTKGVLSPSYTLWFARVLLILLREAMQHGVLFSTISVSLECSDRTSSATILITQQNRRGDIPREVRESILRFALTSGLFENRQSVEDAIDELKAVKGQGDPTSKGLGEQLLRQCLARFPQGAKLIWRQAVDPDWYEVRFAVPVEEVL